MYSRLKFIREMSLVPITNILALVKSTTYPRCLVQTSRALYWIQVMTCAVNEDISVDSMREWDFHFAEMSANHASDAASSDTTLSSADMSGDDNDDSSQGIGKSSSDGEDTTAFYKKLAR